MLPCSLSSLPPTPTLPPCGGGLGWGVFDPSGGWRRLRRLLEQLAADQPAADLRGAGADLVELGVAQQAAGRVVIDVAVAAQTLDRLEGHPGRLLGGVENAAGGVLARGFAAIARLGD